MALFTLSLRRNSDTMKEGKMIREILKDLIKEGLEKFQKQKILPKFELPEIEIEHPEEKTHGDYSTNIAMVIGKLIKKNPLEIAKILVNQLISLSVNQFEKIEVAKPGFVNFFLSKEFLQKQVEEIFKKDFGKLEIGQGKKVNLEFISANPTGPLHIGNGRGAFFGDALANVLEQAGHEVNREYFINDAKKSNQIRELGRTALGLGTMYKTHYLESLIKKIQIPKSKFQTKSKIQNPKEIDEGEMGYLLAQKIQKDNQDFIEKKLKIKFNRWVSEQEFFDSNKVNKIFEFLKKQNLTYDKEGATWLKTSEFGDSQDWVIIRSNGEPTYLLSDIAYHKDKIGRGFKKIIDIWGADHQGHVRKMMAAIKMLGCKGDFDILISQMARLKTGKMSKRKGEIITLEDLIKEVGLDIARLFYLTKSLDAQMEFDLDLAKEQSEKNPVYYIQYANARIHSILAKSKIKYQISKIQIKNQKVLKLLNHSSELELIKQLMRWPEIIEDTARDYQVQRIPQYAIDLATVFHQFYRDCRVITEDRPLSEARLALILATKIILKNTLDLMGISAPEKM